MLNPRYFILSSPRDVSPTTISYVSAGGAVQLKVDSIIRVVIFHVRSAEVGGRDPASLGAGDKPILRSPPPVRLTLRKISPNVHPLVLSWLQTPIDSSIRTFPGLIPSLPTVLPLLLVHSHIHICDS